MKNYFVILNHPNGIVMPLVEGDDNDLAMFESDTDAMAAGYENPLGQNFGFEIFELGGGSHHG